MDYFFSILMALIAYTCISAGFVLMKMGIGWMGRKIKRDKTFYKNLSLWVTGFVIMNIYGVPSAVALKHLPSHIVASFAGWGIVALVFFSYFLLKEKLVKTDIVYSLLIVAGIVLLNLFEKPAPVGSPDKSGMILLAIIPVILFIAGFARGLSIKIKTVVFASVSGISAGLMVVSLRLLVLAYGYDVRSYFHSIYLYAYIAFALLSFIALQAACKKGPMMVIGPVQYSTTIIYPLPAAFLVFNGGIHPLQFPAIALIVYSVIMILKKR
jgi:multidrug transporter EmrE-like cation transporter